MISTIISTRMQVQTKASATSPQQYRSTIDCFRQILANHGWRGVYHGQWATVLREWQGYGAYFLAYEMLVQRATVASGKKVSDLPMWQVMSFGAAAGYAMWIPVFPLVCCNLWDVTKHVTAINSRIQQFQDSIKSRIQTDALDPSKRKYAGWTDCLRQTLRHEGVAGLYRGFLPCLLRAAPVNGKCRW